MMKIFAIFVGCAWRGLLHVMLIAGLESFTLRTTADGDGGAVKIFDGWVAVNMCIVGTTELGAKC